MYHRYVLVCTILSKGRYIGTDQNCNPRATVLYCLSFFDFVLLLKKWAVGCMSLTDAGSESQRMQPCLCKRRHYFCDSNLVSATKSNLMTPLCESKILLLVVQ